MNKQEQERGEAQPIFPQDKIRWRLARKLEREYIEGALDEQEYEREMEALHDALIGE